MHMDTLQSNGQMSQVFSIFYLFNFPMEILIAMIYFNMKPIYTCLYLITNMFIVNKGAMIKLILLLQDNFLCIFVR